MKFPFVILLILLMEINPSWTSCSGLSCTSCAVAEDLSNSSSYSSAVIPTPSDYVCLNSCPSKDYFWSGSSIPMVDNVEIDENPSCPLANFSLRVHLGSTMYVMNDVNIRGGSTLIIEEGAMVNVNGFFRIWYDSFLYVYDPNGVTVTTELAILGGEAFIYLPTNSSLTYTLPISVDLNGKLTFLSNEETDSYTNEGTLFVYSNIHVFSRTNFYLAALILSNTNTLSCTSQVTFGPAIGGTNFTLTNSGRISSPLPNCHFYFQGGAITITDNISLPKTDFVDVTSIETSTIVLTDTVVLSNLDNFVFHSTDIIHVNTIIMSEGKDSSISADGYINLAGSPSVLFQGHLNRVAIPWAGPIAVFGPTTISDLVILSTTSTTDTHVNFRTFLKPDFDQVGYIRLDDILDTSTFTGRIEFSVALHTTAAQWEEFETRSFLIFTAAYPELDQGLYDPFNKLELSINTNPTDTPCGGLEGDHEFRVTESESTPGLIQQILFICGECANKPAGSLCGSICDEETGIYRCDDIGECRASTLEADLQGWCPTSGRCNTTIESDNQWSCSSCSPETPFWCEYDEFCVDDVTLCSTLPHGVIDCSLNSTHPLSCVNDESLCVASPLDCWSSLRHQLDQYHLNSTSWIDPTSVLVNSTSLCSQDHVLCSNGDCVESEVDCYISPACPIGWKRCPSGECISGTDLSATCPELPNCVVGQTRSCGDGFCRNSGASCPPSNGCALETPFLCPDGRCTVSINDCSRGCPADNWLCVDGSCEANSEDCLWPVWLEQPPSLEADIDITSLVQLSLPSMSSNSTLTEDLVIIRIPPSAFSNLLELDSNTTTLSLSVNPVPRSVLEEFYGGYDLIRSSVINIELRGINLDESSSSGAHTQFLEAVELDFVVMLKPGEIITDFCLAYFDEGLDSWVCTDHTVDVDPVNQHSTIRYYAGSPATHSGHGYIYKYHGLPRGRFSGFTHHFTVFSIRIRDDPQVDTTETGTEEGRLTTFDIIMGAFTVVLLSAGCYVVFRDPDSRKEATSVFSTASSISSKTQAHRVSGAFLPPSLKIAQYQPAAISSPKAVPLTPTSIPSASGSPLFNMTRDGRSMKTHVETTPRGGRKMIATSLDSLTSSTLYQSTSPFISTSSLNSATTTTNNNNNNNFLAASNSNGPKRRKTNRKQRSMIAPSGISSLPTIQEDRPLSRQSRGRTVSHPDFDLTNNNDNYLQHYHSTPALGNNSATAQILQSAAGIPDLQHSTPQ